MADVGVGCLIFDTDIARGKILKHMEELKHAKGNGDSLLSIFVPPDVDELSWVTSRLLKLEHVTQNNEYAIEAITSARQKLQDYSEIPPNGLFIFSGTVVTDDGNLKGVSIEFEPYKPMNPYEPMHAFFLCVLGNKFNTERLSKLLEYEDNYVRENDKNIAIWKIKQCMEEALRYQIVDASILVSLVIGPGYEISEITNALDDSVLTSPRYLLAIRSAQQILKRYSKVPHNGLVIYTGFVVTDNGKDKHVAIEFEPYKPPDDSIYRLHKRFFIDRLSDLLEPDPRYGFIVMVDKKALFGVLTGNRKEIRSEFTFNEPMDQIGGADQENNLRMFRQRYFRMVFCQAYKIFSWQNTYDRIPLVLAASPSYYSDLFDTLSYFPLIENRIMYVKEVSYGGMVGFNTAIEISSNRLYHVRFFQEIRLLRRYMEEMNQETGKYVFGVEKTLECLSLGAVKILIVWENLDINRYVLKNSTSEIIRYWNKDQEADQSNFRDSATKAKFEVQEKKSLVEWLVEKYKNFGCTALEFVMNESREGSMFCRGLGGIGGILHYQLDVIGVEETLQCLESLNVKILIVLKNLDINRYELKNSTSKIIIRYWNKDQEADQSNFWDSATNAKFEVQEKKSLVEWLVEECKNFGCTSLEFVMNESQEGSMLRRGLGGIGGILHHRPDTDDLSFDVENSDDLFWYGENSDDLSGDVENSAN